MGTDVIGRPHDFLPPRSDEFQKLWWVRRDRMVFWIYNYLYNECPSPLTFQSCSLKGVLDRTLYDKVLSDLRQVNGFSPGTPVSSTNKTDHHDIAEILLKVALNTISHPARQSVVMKVMCISFCRQSCFCVVFTKNLLTHKPFRLLESECKFTGPNKNKNNFTCLLLYQLAANCLFSHKNIKLFLQTTVVAFNQGLAIFHFSF